MTLGLGVDLVDVERFRRILVDTPTVVDRVLTESERNYCFSFADPAPSIAVRFAAKEATMKALGVGLGAFDFDDVEIERRSSGAPVLVMRGGALTLAEQLGATQWLVSLSHTASAAIATVILK